MLTYEEEDYNHHHETHHRHKVAAPVHIENRNLPTETTSQEPNRDSLAATQDDTNVTTVSNDLGPEEAKELSELDFIKLNYSLTSKIYLSTYYPNGEKPQELIQKLSLHIPEDLREAWIDLHTNTYK